MTDELEQYVLAHIDPEPDSLYRLDRDTHVRLLYSRMCSGHLQGRLLKMLVRMIRPRPVHGRGVARPRCAYPHH